jgi:hypothetical protein
VATDPRDDAWNDDQADMSNEDEWKAHIVAVGADYFDSANTASLAQRSKSIYPVKDSHSYITPYYQRDHAWTDAQHD